MERYDNPTKATWRGWAWNQIQQRSPKRSLVMCLCGDAAKDLPYARKRRLRCVGVDVSKACVDKFREDGGVAVQGKLHMQACLIKPHAIIADMLGGITKTSSGNPLSLLPFCYGFVWNGLRGRDPIGGQIAQAQQKNLVPDCTTGRLRWSKQANHRGKALFMMAVSYAWQMHSGLGVVGHSSAWKEAQMVQIPTEFVEKIGRLYRPCYSSYRSKDGGQWFDSVAMTGLKQTSAYGEIDIKQSRKADVQKRRAAAAKALLTMGRG